MLSLSIFTSLMTLRRKERDSNVGEVSRKSFNSLRVTVKLSSVNWNVLPLLDIVDIKVFSLYV